MKLFRRLIYIINYKTFIVTSLGIISTYICHRLGLVADFPLTLISIAIVFPIVFSINTAFKRRELALQQYAIIRGHFAAIYYASRDWIDIEPNPYPSMFKAQFLETLKRIKTLLMSSDHTNLKYDRDVYRQFNEISRTIQELRLNGLNTSEISRTNQYLSKMMIAFESMRNIAFYRTPITLRAYSEIFIYSFPILYGPYFAHTFQEYDTHLAYLMPVLYSFILVSLANIQNHLEHPYDDLGEDDIRLDIVEIENMLHSE